MPGKAVRWFRGVWSIALLAAALPAYGRHQTHERSARNAGITVMGEVRTGGVYVLPVPNPSLESVLKQAGSLTANATGSVKIVRNGRMTLQTHVRPGAEIQLQHGDVVIVQGRKNSARDAPSGTVEVALLNLIDRPVLIHLRPEHANVRSLIELLGQPADVATTLRILGPVAKSPERDGDLMLQSGCILVFDPRAVQRERVPKLPRPVVVRQLTIRPAGADAGDVRNGPLFQRQTVPQAPGVEGPPPKIEPQKRSPRAQSDADVPGLRPPEPGEAIQRPAPVKSAAGDSEPLNDQWRPAETPAPSQTGIAIASGPTEPPAAEPPSRSAAPLDTGSQKIAEPEREESSFDMLTLVICLFAGLGVIAAGGFLISMGRKAAAGDRPVVRAIPAATSTLDQLIRNKLEVCEEPFEMAASLEFFGRTASTPRSRFDETHADKMMPGPHFTQRPSDEAGKDTSRENDSSLRADAGQPAPPAPASSRGVLDRALSSVVKKETV